MTRHEGRAQGGDGNPPSATTRGTGAKPIVYVARALPGDAFARLRELTDLRGGDPTPRPREEQIALAADAVVYVPTYLDPVDAALLEALPLLRLVASYGVGTDHIDLAACRARGVVITNTPGVLTEATADLTFALLLAAARRVAEGDRFVRAGLWTSIDPTQFLGCDVHGRMLGLIGFGRIGQAVARRAYGFGMKVIYASPRTVDFPGLRRLPLEELLAAADFVSIHCPLTEETRGLLSKERLALMKPGAVLVNTARGAIVDETALADALASGHLRAAGIDVFTAEPSVSPVLRAQPHVVLTPHIGSGSTEARLAMSQIVADEIRRFVAGEHLRHRVV